MLMDSALLQSETQYAFAAHQPWGEALLLWVCTVELLLPEPLIGIGQKFWWPFSALCCAYSCGKPGSSCQIVRPDFYKQTCRVHAL